MERVLGYYQARHIDPKIELVSPSALDGFVAAESEWQRMALWMGKPSLLEKMFPPSRIDTLINGGDTPVLILR